MHRHLFLSFGSPGGTTYGLFLLCPSLHKSKHMEIVQHIRYSNTQKSKSKSKKKKKKKKCTVYKKLHLQIFLNKPPFGSVFVK